VFHFAHEAAGATGTRLSLRPLISIGQSVLSKLAQTSGEIARPYLLLFEKSNPSCRHPPPGLAFGEPDDRLRRVIQYSRDVCD
jgi:hypothetical protein